MQIESKHDLCMRILFHDHLHVREHTDAQWRCVWILGSIYVALAKWTINALNHLHLNLF